MLNSALNRLVGHLNTLIGQAEEKVVMGNISLIDVFSGGQDYYIKFLELKSFNDWYMDLIWNMK